jgi:hypothetical protein
MQTFQMLTWSSRYYICTEVNHFCINYIFSLFDDLFGQVKNESILTSCSMCTGSDRECSIEATDFR